MTQDDNKRIAELMGWKWIGEIEMYLHPSKGGGITKAEADFSQPGPCFEYVVPWFNEQGYILELQQIQFENSNEYFWRVYLNGLARTEHENLFQAICNAATECFEVRNERT